MNKIYPLFLIGLFCVLTAQASEPKIWTVNTRAEVLRGDAEGVSIDDNGTITVAPKLNELYNTTQPYVWSSAIDAGGNVFLGTGSDGKIYKVDAGGGGKLFADLDELNVSALTIGKNGELYAGTSPDGKVYRIDASGAATVFFAPNEKYIWSLAVFGDGSLAVGTGENGKIYRVKTANAAPASSLFFDTSETHIISLAVDKSNNLYAGTDASGLVLRFTPDGKPFALLDSPLREIHALAVGADNSVYALALGDSIATAAPPTVTTETAAAPDALVTPTPAKSRYDLTGAKTAVYRILPDGGANVIYNSSSIIGFSLAARTGGVLLGTSDKGRIYSISDDGREKLVAQTDQNQVSTLFQLGPNIYATASNQGKLFRFGAAAQNTSGASKYESPILDAKLTSGWGRIWWRGTSDVAIQTRSGNTEKPDETWSAWSDAKINGADAGYRGAAISSPNARFLQWRAVFGGKVLPKETNSTIAESFLSEVNVSYLTRNIAPEILAIDVLPNNVALLANPPFPLDPNIETSGLDPQNFGIVIPPATARRVFKRGSRGIQWTAEDRNDDKIIYDIYYRRVENSYFLLLKENVAENFYTIDGAALTDGRYVFKIVAKDAPSNPPNLALSSERISEPVEIDNTAPTVAAIGQPQITNGKVRAAFTATDAAGNLSRAEYSVNGGDWKEVYADDGISDSSRETYTIEIELPNAGENTLSLRVFDSSGNFSSAQITARR